MMRISLSERFGHVQVTGNHSDSESEISDDELLPNKAHADHNSCNTLEKSTCDSSEKTEEKDFSMKPEWLELFEKIINKTRNVSFCLNKEKQTPLHDTMPQVADSLHKGNQNDKQSENFNLVNDDLIISEFREERDGTGENEENSVEEVNYVTEERAGKSKVEDRLTISTKGINQDTMNDSNKENICAKTNVATVNSTDSATIELEGKVKSSTMKDTTLDKEYKKNILNAENIELDVKTLGKTVNEDLRNEDIAERLRNQQHSTIQQQDSKREESEMPKKIRDDSETKLKKLTIDLEKLDNISEASKEKTCDDNKKAFNEVENTKDSFEKIFKADIEDASASNKFLLENVTEISKKKVTQEKVGAKSKLSAAVPQLKTVSKVKSFEIKPAMSFPLDELLPITSTEDTKKRKANENTSTNTDCQKKRHASETYSSNQLTASNEPTYSQPTPEKYHVGDVFHGTVYGSSPKDDVSADQSAENESVSFPNAISTPEALPYTSTNETPKYDPSFECDTGMANLLAALQSGNRQVISLFQDALHNQIGCNLEVLANKSRQGSKQFQNPTEYNSPMIAPFGFYTEKPEMTNQGSCESGENKSERYEELLQLLIDQCSGLVQTEDDQYKLKSLLNVLQKEGEGKFTGTVYNVPDVERNTEHASPDKVQGGGYCSPNETMDEGSDKVNNDIELFEGRTLLKGGVPVRHIPKTKVHKVGQDIPKDPRPSDMKPNIVRNIPLPKFATDLYGEKKVKQMLHIDWSTVRPHSCVSEKDPRVKRASAIDENLKLIVDATKTLIENLQVPQDSSASDSKKSQKSISKIETCVPVRTPQKDNAYKNIESSVDTKPDLRHIPVLITNSNQDTNQEISQNIRSSTLHTIDTNNSNILLNKEKKINKSILKPLEEKAKSKVTKPSIGVVKPIQLTGSETNKVGILASAKSKSSGKRQLMKEEFEEGEIPQKLSKKHTNNEIEKTSVDDQKFYKADSYLKFYDKHAKKTEPLNERYAYHKEKIDISDVSDDEEGQIDSDIETRRKRYQDWKKGQSSKYKSRNYRSRHRSSSRSSVESRVSHTSLGEKERACYYGEVASRYSYDKTNKTRYESSVERNRYETSIERNRYESSFERNRYETSIERNRYDSSIERNRYESGTNSRVSNEGLMNSVRYEKSVDRTKHKSPTDKMKYKSSINEVRQASSLNRDKTDMASMQCYSGDPVEYDSRRRHFSSIDDRSTYRDTTDRSGAVKRHGNHDNNRRKRHKTEGHKTNSYSDVSLSDDDLAAEYHARYQSTSKPGKQKMFIPENLKISLEPQDSDTSNKKILQSHPATSNLADYKAPPQTHRKPRRKSLEEKEKEKQEDKEFLEMFKQKYAGNSSVDINKSATVQSGKVSTTKTDKSVGVYKTMTESTGGLSYSDMLHLADLEEGKV